MDRYAIATNKTPPPDKRSPLEKELWEKGTNLQEAISKKTLSAAVISQLMGYSQIERDLYDRTFGRAELPSDQRFFEGSTEEDEGPMEDDEGDPPEGVETRDEENGQEVDPAENRHIMATPETLRQYEGLRNTQETREAIIDRLRQLVEPQQESGPHPPSWYFGIPSQLRGHSHGFIPAEGHGDPFTPTERVRLTLQATALPNRNGNVYERPQTSEPDLPEGSPEELPQKSKKPKNLRYKLIKKAARETLKKEKI